LLVDRTIKNLFYIGRFPVSIIRAVCFVSFVCLVPLSVSINASASTSVTLHINNNLYYAVLTENRELLARIETRGYPLLARHYRGKLEGYPDSAVRITLAGSEWFGIVVLDGEIFRLARQTREAGLITDTVEPLEALSLAVAAENQLCGMERLMHDPAALSYSMTTSAATMPQAAGVNPPCSNPVNGLCLLPHIEFAYDLSYQAMPNFGMTVLDRAVSEINEMELFFGGLGYRFSQVSLTMLDSVQDSAAGSASASDLESFVIALRQKRANGEFAYLNPSNRSIFHFVTGRNFPPINGSNVVGIAYPNAVCDVNGYSTGVTDAGDVGNVVDPANSLVSLIMAHEIGHNLGAGHDDLDNSCPPGQFVMTASIGANGSSISEFSSCSIAEIQQEVDLFGSQACMDYPLDAAITEVAGNISEPKQEVSFQSGYSIDVQANPGAGVITRIGISGEISDPDQGCFLSASAGIGQNCVVAVDGLSYECELTSPAATFNLSVESVVNENVVEFSAQHNVFSANGSLVEVVPSDNSFNQFYNTFAMIDPADTLVECPDNSIQPATNNNSGSGSAGSNSSSSGSGGGGGSVGAGSILFLLGHLLLRYRRRNIG